MTKQMWINLPVKDLNKSKEFFSHLGFSAVMLFPESTLKTFTKHEIVDTKEAIEVIFSIDAESREEVDEMAKKAVEAGGTLFAEPGENQGWMYGCGFADLDGHRWNMLYMDMSKMPRE
jgi:predicted lactoylglutathione lyase